MSKFAARALTPLVTRLMVCLSACLPSSLVAAFPDTSKLYWVEGQHTISEVKTDGTGLEQTVPPVGHFLSGLVIDGRTNHVYTNDGFAIRRSDVGGANAALLYAIPNATWTGALALDPFRNNLFFTDNRNNVIYRSSLTGADALVISPARGTPQNGGGIAQLSVDPVGEKVYFSYQNTFRRMNFDGSGEQVLFTSPDLVLDFEADYRNGIVYWSSPNNGQRQIQKAKFDGTDAKVIANLTGGGAMALSRTEGKLYFTDNRRTSSLEGDFSIQVVNVDGTGRQRVHTIGTSIINQPGNLTFAVIPEPTAGALATIASLTIGACRRRSG